MIATYGTMLFLSVVTGFLFIIVMQMKAFNQMGTSVTSPSYIGQFLASINPAVLFATFLSPELNRSITDMTNIDFPIWAGYLIFYGLITVVALFIAVKKLRVNMKRLK